MILDLDWDRISNNFQKGLNILVPFCATHFFEVGCATLSAESTPQPSALGKREAAPGPTVPTSRPRANSSCGNKQGFYLITVQNQFPSLTGKSHEQQRIIFKYIFLGFIISK